MGRWLALCLALPPWLAGCGPSISPGATGGPDASGPAPGDGPCTPGAAFCAGDTSMVCRAVGSGHDALFCDPVQGVGCDLDSGRCQGPCAPQFLTQSYIGCDYYPTITGNEVNGQFDFAVAVSNTSSETADVTVEWGGLDGPITFQVPPGRVQVQPLPWNLELKGCLWDVGIECSNLRRPVPARVPKGAFRLRSTRPVTVYQFNPLDYAHANGTFSYTNDASLLLPANALRGRYVVASWPDFPGGGNSPSLLAITATADDTRVTITPRADTEAAPGVPAFTAGVAQAVTLHQGDVLELFAYDGDLTGSLVDADRPVQVIGGHFCTFIPASAGYCDHLEESMFPIDTLSTEYAVTAPAIPALPDGKVEYVRVVATQPDTRLTYDPPQAAPAYLAAAGDHVEIADNADSFTIRADKKILVAQYMEGQEVAGGTGDPAMALAVPTDQFRRQYLFLAPVNYETNYVNLLAPAGAVIVLDGQPVGGFVPIGAGGLGLRRVVLGAGEGGNHTVTGDMPFGISVYGYGQYTSYWYPGGLDLSTIPNPE